MYAKSKYKMYIYILHENTHHIATSRKKVKKGNPNPIQTQVCIQTCNYRMSRMPGCPALRTGAVNIFMSGHVLCHAHAYTQKVRLPTWKMHVHVAGDTN